VPSITTPGSTGGSPGFPGTLIEHAASIRPESAGISQKRSFFESMGAVPSIACAAVPVGQAPSLRVDLRSGALCARHGLGGRRAVHCRIFATPDHRISAKE
jgi:hypothetical protein